LARWYGGIDDFDVYRMHYSLILLGDHNLPLVAATYRLNDSGQSYVPLIMLLGQ
jgi:hypothetical protein